MRLSAALALLACAVLAGCASLFNGKADPGAAAPATQAYRFTIEAPEPLAKLLTDHLDLARFRQATDTDRITDEELARLVAAAPAQARALLETEGYFAAEVQADRIGDAGSLPTVRVRVQPGPRARVTALTLGATGALQDAAGAGNRDAIDLLAQLRGAWPLPPGAPFRQGAWSDAKSTTIARVRAEGYPSATWERTHAQVDATDHTVKLEALATSGPLYRLGEIRVEGLQRYDADSVRRLATFGRGTPYNEKLLLDFQERVQKAGLFEGASVEVDTDPASAEAAPVLVKVKELPLQTATIGVGYSANTGQRVTFEHLHRRVFGTRWTAKNKFELGRDLQSWGGELTSHPLEGLYRNLVAGSAEKLTSADEIRTSASVRVGRTQDTPRIERLYYLEYVHAKLEATGTLSNSDALSANYHWVWRHIDNVLLPTDGLTLSAQVAGGYAWSSTADDGPFGRATARLTWYKPLGASWYATLRVEGGQVLAKDSVGVPDTLLFRAGGDDSVRGYAYRTLGPLVNGSVTSGRLLGTASFEIARPISPKLPSVWWAAFIDAGNSANRWSDLDPAVGVGLGLRWRSPVGPLRVDIAYGERVRKTRLHLSVGIAF